MKNKKISLLLIYFISFLYMEFLYRVLLYDHVFRFTNINMILFLICFSLFLFIISKLFSEKANKIIYYVVMSIIAIWFSAEYIVKDVFDFYISFSVLHEAGQLGDFMGETLLQISKRIWIIVLMFLPTITTIFLNKKINYKKNKTSKSIVLLVIFIISALAYYGSLFIGKNSIYSAYELSYKINDISLTFERLGILNTSYIDTKRKIFGFEEKITITNNGNKKPVNVSYKYNNLNINFDSMIENEDSSVIKSMSEYFKNETGTLQNKYTGYFENKNLILFMAESFNEMVVSEKLTPTLYKLVNNGFSFDKFYSPTIMSTIGGEMQELTGLYPQAYGVFKTGTTYFPLGLATVFQEKGYNTFAYHDHYYDFQSRNLYLKSLGFNNYKGCYNGLEKVINCNAWPESDIELMNNTFDDYASSDKPFMVFYATVSGHGSWPNSISYKYMDLVEEAGIDAPDTIKGYIASQIELDKALETLIKKLEEKGILDDTVIALVGDHYPYLLTESGKDAEIKYFTNTLKKDLHVEISRSNFILYNSKMETVNVKKVGSQIDVLPTIYNLFKIPYDSRLIIGKDILSTEEGLAMFDNRSWVSDKGTYFASTGKFVPINDSVFGSEDEQNTYVKNMISIVNGKILMSGNLLNNNYYKAAWNYLAKDEIKETEKADDNIKEEG